MTKILLEQLVNIIEKMVSIEPIIIYIGVGTEYHSISDTIWNFKDNQQFPPFIHDAKLKFSNIKIIIILIDSLLSDIPYMITDDSSLLTDTWVQDSKYFNMFKSSMNLDVIAIREEITWGDFDNNSIISKNITEIMIQLCTIVNLSNSLLFYHEFTGRNPILLEHYLKKNIDYNSNKICIDITKGADSSCYFNLLDPENYPIITYCNNSELLYLNPNNLNKEQEKIIYEKYKYYTKDIINENQLISTEDELVLYFQIVKQEKLIIKLLNNSIISLIRQLYTLTNIEHINSKMCQIQYFDHLKIKFEFVKKPIDNILTKLLIIDNLHLNEQNSSDYINNVNTIKIQLLDDLNLILKLILLDIGWKHNLHIENIELLMKQFNQLDNKYNIMSIFIKFIENLYY